MRSSEVSRPHLLLSDRDMPGIDGLDLCPRFKTSAPSAGCLVVIISGSPTQIANRVTGLNAGADGSVLRPIPHRAHPTWVEPFARIAHLTRELRARKAEPAATLAKVPPLRGRRPICAGCKKNPRHQGLFGPNRGLRRPTPGGHPHPRLLSPLR